MLKKINQQINLQAKNHTKEIKQLKELEKYRKEFIGNVSHELKTPIFNIQGYLLTLIEGGINDPNINELYLKRAEKSIDRMILIVNDLEAISKLEAHKLELNYDNFNIEELINDIFDMQMLRAKEKNISFNILNNLNKKLIVNADKKWISRLVINLIVNSINYGKNDGNTSISIKELENKYLIEISDNGCGISETELPRIFERFYRADKSRSREQGGTGLGLSIVKHIIEAHNQQITVESIVNKGTKFAFTLNKAK
ncbi:MAG: sensor histidine kinase [Bacteroidales bacterium]|nr:sensor histidine kinase [Bacteroidales bacterium]